jgi:hypothetical protein
MATFPSEKGAACEERRGQTEKWHLSACRERRIKWIDKFEKIEKSGRF